MSDAAAPRVPPPEEPLGASDRRLRLALEAGQIGLWDWDIVEDRVEWSDQVYRLHGLEPGSFTGGVAGFAELVHPDDLPEVQRRLERALAEPGTDYEAEFRALVPGSGERWLATRAHVVRDHAGRPLRLVGATRDITAEVAALAAERAARQAADAARRRLELLWAAGQALSVSLEPQATLQAIAAVVVPDIADWCRIDLIDADGVLQRALTHHRDPARAALGAELAARLHASVQTTGSMAWVAAHGQARHVRFPLGEREAIADVDLRAFVDTLGLRAAMVVPLVARGRTLGALAALQAESGREFDAADEWLLAELAQRAALAIDNARLYAEAGRARRDAEDANRAKDEFLAMLGHELRNPLAPIVTTLQLMRRRDDGAHRAERRIVERQVAHLSRLVDDLLDVSRIARGKIVLERERLDLRQVVRRAMELTRPLFDGRRAPTVELPPSALPVDGDAVRLTQVVANLVSNAAKFTPPQGAVMLRLRARDDRAELEVEDEGAGIAPELLPRLFELFVQGAQRLDRESGGLGLGLAIVRTLVRMHGGEVEAASDGPGRGSRFTVRLPLAAGKAAVGAVPSTAPLAAPEGARVLVVDDNRDAAESLAELLRLCGWEVQVAGDATAALATLQRAVPDVAVLDIGLPGIDGHELARRLRADARCGALRLVALTGYGRDNDRAQARAAGFDEHLVKPAPPDRLLELLAELVGEARAATGRPA